VHTDTRRWWSNYLQPRFWPTWLMFFLLWLLTRLPFVLQMQTGRLLGWLAYRLARQRKHIAAVNIRLCFPELDSHQQGLLLKKHFLSLGQGIVETALCWWGRDRQLQSRYTLIGEDYLRDALARGKGVILLSAHFTTLELGGRLLARQCPFHVLYRPHKNPLFEAVMQRARIRRFEKAIPREATRALLASLKQNRAVWYAPDQNHGRRQSLFVPFFGVSAATLATTSRLAKLSGAAVVPFFQMRRPDNSGYLLMLCPALTDFPGDDLHADTSRINRLFEAVIREMPEQYLWVHRRFKTRPEGEAYPY